MATKFYLIGVLSLLILSFGTVFAEQLPVDGVRASSSMQDSVDASFAPGMAIDGKVSTFWAEGEASAGLGDWIEFDFGKEVILSRLVVYSGNWYSKEFFKRHNRLKRIQLKFSDRTQQHLDLQDKMEGQVLQLEKPVKTRSIRLVLKDVYAGSTFNDTCLAEILFFNDLPGPRMETVKLSATSMLPPDSAGSYGPDKLLDRIMDTPWCEGKKDDGKGESLTLKLPGETALKELRILNGVAASKDVYEKNNRIVKFRIETPGTEAREVQIEDKLGEFAVISLEGTTTASIKLTILEVVAGTKFNDTCISEIEVIAAP